MTMLILYHYYFSDSARPVCLPLESINYRKYKLAVTTGWGLTSSDGKCIIEEVVGIVIPITESALKEVGLCEIWTIGTF